MKVEICVNSVESAVAAQVGGAQRVELCDDLVEGGTTPSFGSITKAREMLDIKLHVIIRPRGGDFLYSELEFDIMRRDIVEAKRLGVDGIVIGILDADGNIDAARTRELVELARPMTVTFHRAFDVSRDARRSLETLIEIGVDRVLTSGQCDLAADGKELLAEIIGQADGRIKILVCGGLCPDNIAEIAASTGADEFHFTAFKNVESEMRYRNENVPMGGAAPASEFVRPVTDPAIVSEMLARLDACRG